MGGKYKKQRTRFRNGENKKVQFDICFIFFCCCCFYTKMMFEMSLRDSRLRCMHDWETFSWVGQTDPLEEG